MMYRWIEKNSEKEREVWKYDSPSLALPPFTLYYRGRAAKTIHLGNEKWNAKSLDIYIYIYILFYTNNTSAAVVR